MKDRRAHGKYLIEEEKNANPKKTQIKNKSTTKPTEDIRNRKKKHTTKLYRYVYNNDHCVHVSWHLFGLFPLVIVMCDCVLDNLVRI